MDEDTENLLTGLRLHKDSDGIAEFMLQLEREGPCPPTVFVKWSFRKCSTVLNH